MKKIFFVLSLAFIFSGSSYAAKSKSKTMPMYGAAGCGLGAMLFGSKPGLIQVVAATFNGTSANQTFGITSGTSNCATKTTKSAEAIVFIEANKIALQNDSARGYGETLESLLEIYSCDGSAKSDVQSNYKIIFSNSDVEAIESAMSQVLNSNNCKA